MNSLISALMRLAYLQRQSLDKNELQSVLEALKTANPSALAPQTLLKLLTTKLRWTRLQVLSDPTLDPSQLPCLVCRDNGDWRILKSINSQSQWVIETENTETLHSNLSAYLVFKINFQIPFDRSNSPVWQLIKSEIRQHRSKLIDAGLSGVMLNVLALAISFYSMQIYDRVIPTNASATLWVLSLGVLVAIMFEWISRTLRSDLNDAIVTHVDQRLGREVFMRFLNVRLDKLPQSVGSLTGQLKAYESVRSFLTNSAAQMLIDAPFAILFLLTIGVISGWLTVIPLTFLLISMGIGLRGLGEIESRSHAVSLAHMRKTGLLVEAIEGAETLKSGQGGWRQLSLWQSVSETARAEEIRLRKISDSAQHTIQAFQQIAYVTLVACGALLIAKGEMSMGSLIACTILSGRILQPVAALPSQLIQWGHCKSALKGLDQIWRLPSDHHDQQPLVLENISGAYQLKDVAFHYGQQAALQIPKFDITPGERIGILGPIGAGKTTLLRLLSGMYKPQVGEIKLDGVALTHIAKPMLAEQLGYLQQEGRLFEGTLRDNLLVGLIDPGDEVLRGTAQQTGLLQSVVAHHPLGFDLPIFEGGQGLSGGQRQLVNLTRVFLRRPRIWLMDEPTAAMDLRLAEHVTEAIKQALKPQDTLVLVTHKPEMLHLVDRLVVISQHQIVLDGPKAQVLQKLHA